MAQLFKASGGVVGSKVIPKAWAAAPSIMSGTPDRNDDTAYTWDAANSRVTLPSSGLADGYLIIAAYEFEDSSNGRFNPQGKIVQNSGTGSFVGSATGGYSRDNSEDRAYVRTWGFVDGPSASATFELQWQSDTDSANTIDGTVRSEFQVIPFYYSDIGMYSSTSATRPGGTTPVVITGFSADLEGTNITISSNVVSLTGDNKRYLVLGSQYFEGPGLNSRTQRWHGFDIDGTQENAAKAYSMYRLGSDDESGELFTWLIETVTATVTIEQTCYRGDGVSSGQGGADIDDDTTMTAGDHAIVVIELNDSAEVFRNTGSTNQNFATTGPVDVQASKVADVDFNDSASFVRATDIGMNAEVAMDGLFGANISGASQTVGSGLRWTAYSEFTIDGVEDSDSFAGDYGRGNQSSQDCFGWSANLLGFQALAEDEDIGVSVTELSGSEGGGGAWHLQVGWAGFWGINLDTLEAAGGETATGAPSIILPTSAGTAQRGLHATGAPSIILPTSAGEAQVTRHATGAPSIILPTAAGAAELIHPATGAPSIILPTAAGVAQVTRHASGAPSIILPTAAGASRLGRKATGAPSIILPTSAGEATVQGEKTADGAPAIILPTAAGTAQVTRHATGAPVLPLITSEGAASAAGQETATGAPSIILPTASGAARLGRMATGAPSIILPTSAGTAKITRRASGASALPLITSEGVAAVLGAKTASGAPAIILPTAAGAAQVTRHATGSPAIILPTAAGAATVTRHATGSPSIPLLTSEGVAAIAGSKTATGAPTIPLVTAAGTAVVTSQSTQLPGGSSDPKKLDAVIARRQQLNQDDEDLLLIIAATVERMNEFSD